MRKDYVLNVDNMNDSTIALSWHTAKLPHTVHSELKSDCVCVCVKARANRKTYSCKLRHFMVLRRKIQFLVSGEAVCVTNVTGKCELSLQCQRK